MCKILYFLKAPQRWFRKMYEWTLHWAKTKQAPYALFGVAFVESSFFPVPPDVLLIAMVMFAPKRWIRYSVICTAGSVCGALFGYFIGWGLYETIGKFIVQAYHMQATVEKVGRMYTNNAFFTVFTAAFTPIPYKAITITAGLFKISLVTLVVASIIGRSGRFFLVAAALRVFGEKIEHSIEKYFDFISIILVVLLVGGFLAFKYLWK
ncbi:MAG: DedA family protein [Candidatus Omnitrophica bacterium]|nr:DedA family protein [Candidatus Omnitrophota bacterium]